MDLEIVKIFYTDKTVANNSHSLIVDLLRVFSQPTTDVVLDSVIIKQEDIQVTDSIIIAMKKIYEQNPILC